VAWLIWGTSIDPRLNPDIGWTDIGYTTMQEVERGENAKPLRSRLELRKAKHSRRESPPPCFFRPAGRWIVCDEFKQIVDVLEPEMNRFHPVTLLNKAGEEYPWDYNLMIVTQAADTLILEKSYVHSHTNEFKLPSGEVKRSKIWSIDPQPAFLAAKKDRIAGMHLWRGGQHFQSYLFVSDELMKRVKRAKLRGLVVYPITEE
jgi:hypothetical protein